MLVVVVVIDVQFVNGTCMNMLAAGMLITLIHKMLVRDWHVDCLSFQAP